MASTLLSNVNSRAQYQANLLTNTPNLVRVLVEDEQDIPIWYRILKANAPTYQFQIQPYSFDPTHHGKGKTNVLAQCNQLESELRNGHGLTPEDAYLYVRGHNLHEFIIHTFFYPIEEMLQQEHKQEITAHLTGKSINEGMEHYNRVSKSFAKQYLLRHSYTNPSCSPVIRRICGDIRATWT